MQKKQPFGLGNDDMNIKNLSIGDSQIKEYKLENQTLTMILEDYTETSYEIVMTNCCYIFVRGSVGFSLSEGKFTTNKTGEHWCFYDEDGATLELRFKNYEMKQVTNK